MGLKMAAVVALGAPAVAVLAFEVVLNATAMFNHAAIRTPPRLERWLRLFVVTPGDAPDAPFGGAGGDEQLLRLLPALVGPAVRELPRAPRGRDTVVIGVQGWREERQQRLDRLLMQPARSMP
jgi:hypothetical protein